MNATPIYASILFMIVILSKIAFVKFSRTSEQSNHPLRNRSHATQVRAHNIIYNITSHPFIRLK